MLEQLECDLWDKQPPKLLTGTCSDRVKPRNPTANCNSGKFRKLQITQKLGEERVNGNALVKFQNWPNILHNNRYTLLSEYNKLEIWKHPE